MTDDSRLRSLGWTDEWAREWSGRGDPDLAPGRVSLEHNHVFRVITADGERLAEASGRIKHEAASAIELPVVGDWVGVRVDATGGRSQIRRLLPRRTWLSRKAAGRTTDEQVLAANVDTVLVVFALDVPVNTNAIERYLVACRPSGAAPVVVLNKADLADDADRSVAEARTTGGDLPVVATSTQSGLGLDRLEAWLGPGQTIALIGPSGVGKSSIVNRLAAHALLPTGAVRDWDARGRHTSVHRQLVVRAEGGVIIDTPGLRELQLWQTDAVLDAFDDVAALAGSCRFRDCRHDREPGCAVKAAVETGTIGADRYASFLKLHREQAAIEEKRVARERELAGRSAESARAARHARPRPKR